MAEQQKKKRGPAKGYGGRPPQEATLEATGQTFAELSAEREAA